MRWLGVATDLEAAKLWVRELAETVPGQYFIFSLATGHRLDIKVDQVGANAEPKKKQPTSESEEARRA